MGKFDKEVKSTFYEYLFSEISSDDELLNCIRVTFSNLLQIIQEYRSRFIPRKKLEYYLDRIDQSTDYKIELNLIRKEALLENKLDDDLLPKLYDSAKMVLTILVYITNQEPDQILEDLYSLYEKKNDSYGDTWHGRGSYGIYTELERKVFRLNRVECLPDKDCETIEDTLKDILNYITFFIICLKYVDPEIASK